ncbi:endonuclease MutS2 [Nannocystaceae bacterium ST9]
MVRRLSHSSRSEGVLARWLADGRGDALRHLGWLDLCGILAESLSSDLARRLLDEELEAIAAIQRGEDEASLAERSPGVAAACSRLPGVLPEDQVERAQARQHELDGFELLGLEASREGNADGMRRGLRELEDLAPSLAALRRGSPLAVVELIGVAELCRVAGLTSRLLSAVDERRDLVPEQTRGFAALCTRLRGERDVDAPVIDSLPELLATLDRSIERDGDEPRIADRASAELARARKHQRACKQGLLAKAERMVRSAELGESLRDRFWTDREGRVVLPIRSDALGKVRGPGTIIHGSSGSGQTFFVEPAALVEDNNALREAESAAIEEERKVRRELSAKVAAHAEQLIGMQAAMLELDRIAARLELSDRLEGVSPELGSDAAIELRSARHPLMLLDGVEVVPNDIVLERGHGLIISGPNAGGKTVALKTLGLCALMAAAGLRVPCRGRARMPLFRHVITDVGDDQSITANLSTFSAHVGHVRDAVHFAAGDGAGTLVLLDEIAVGTDPEQGAALAEAILLHLVEAGATVVVTTHYDRLKLLATRTGEARAAGRFHNGAVGFDIQRMRPTFRLTLGVPGSSSAIAVARRLGLVESILIEAEGLLGDQGLKIDQLLREIDAERQTLVRTRERLERDKQRLAARDSEVRDREARVLEGVRSRKAKAYAAAVDQLRALERELADKRKELRRMTPERVDELPTRDQIAGEAKQVLAEQRAVDERERLAGVELAPVEAIKVGAKVRVVALGQTGEVVAIAGKKVTVQLALSRMTVKPEELALAEVEAKPRKVKAGKAKPILDFAGRLDLAETGARQAAAHFGESPAPVSTSVDNVCDVRGERYEDAQDRVAEFVARALARDQDVVVIRHGHGSGALRNAVREALKRLGNVRKVRGGLVQEGGEGVTVAWVE